MKGTGKMAFCLNKKLARLFLIIGMISLVSVSSALEPKNKKKPQIVLPEVIYATPGIEMNVYFDNVFLMVNPANYVFEINCPKGMQQNERWTFTPKKTDVGDHAFELKVRDGSNKIIAKGKSVLRVSKPDAGANKKLSVLMIGDSLTHNSVISRHLLDLCKDGRNPKIKLIGSHHPGEAKTPENVHEGYGGWTAGMFLKHYTGVYKGHYKKRGSPFVFKNPKDGKLELDFQRYCDQYNDGNPPDIVTIFLGWNNITNTNDKKIDRTLKSMFNNYDKLIKMIRKVGPNTKIGLMVLTPTAATQDASGNNYGNKYQMWSSKKNQFRLCEVMLQRFKGREKEGIYLIPTHINIDNVNNFSSKSVAVNARNPKKIKRQNNACHPAPSGYMQIGDTLYCWLKSKI